MITAIVQFKLPQPISPVVVDNAAGSIISS